MAEAIRVSGPVSGTDKTLTFETGRFALQSRAPSGLAGQEQRPRHRQRGQGVREGIDFFPLTVDVEERAYAAGKIPGSFFRREGRPTEDAILTCRLTDRPLRPVRGGLPERDPDRGHGPRCRPGEPARHDLHQRRLGGVDDLGGIPFEGPIGAVRLAYSQDGTWIPHPTYEEGDASTFELVVAGRELDNGDVAVMMVEAGGTEKSVHLLRGRRPEGHRGRRG